MISIKSESVAQLSLLLLGLTSLALGDVSHLPPANLEYSITPSSQVAYYHYPAPRGQQLRQVARQFAAPALEHAAFTQALTSRGYVFGAGNTAAASAPLTAAVAPSATGRSIAAPATHADGNSLNLKLPVPFGVMPLNVAHLPLQAGAPYASVPHTTGLTSYGTAQVQRR
ncbi:uncharacterized protein LOC132791287 [Drosophila nasuta]|uniref:uncharacterized protein LOC132791287 n=1 Tax=Drosophila nasuta TaxID=42062 RepID=UPI00295E59FB|nr:uncharacterized protein LOC132791287 [Drosophila nasuta]